MKLIHQSAQILPQENSLFEHITECGYTCYKTNKDITKESAEKFVNNLIKSGHTSVLEHGTVYMLIPVNSDVAAYYLDDVPTWTSVNLTGKKVWAVTTNYRRLLELNRLEDLKYICTPTPFHNKRVTVRLITNIAIGRELTRHRVFSFSQESTRYCNYGTNRFNNELTFIKPLWYKDPFSEEGIEYNESFGFQQTCVFTEQMYLEMINNGVKPQDARDVLPLSTKTELVMTGFINDWKQVFAQRIEGVTGTPHPMIKSLLEPIQKEFIDREWI